MLSEERWGDIQREQALLEKIKAAQGHAAEWEWRLAPWTTKQLVDEVRRLRADVERLHRMVDENNQSWLKKDADLRQSRKEAYLLRAENEKLRGAMGVWETKNSEWMAELREAKDRSMIWEAMARAKVWSMWHPTATDPPPEGVHLCGYDGSFFDCEWDGEEFVCPHTVAPRGDGKFGPMEPQVIPNVTHWTRAPDDRREDASAL